MKNCPYCKIEVGGNLKHCPFCQSALSGESEVDYFPKHTSLKIQSFFYKLQMFIVLVIIIVSLSLEFLFDLKLFGGIHYSLLIAMWLFAFEFGLIRLFKKGTSSSRVLTLFVTIVTVLLMITGKAIGFYDFVVEWIVPVIIIGTLIANFVLAMVDQIANALVYLLTNLVVGMLPYLVFFAMGRDIPIAWIASLVVSVILLVGAIVFKGRPVLSEIQRRFNV